MTIDPGWNLGWLELPDLTLDERHMLGLDVHARTGNTDVMRDLDWAVDYAEWFNSQPAEYQERITAARVQPSQA